MLGKTLAHYEVTSMLGKGGMGEVYRARDTKLGRDVALKILPHELSGDPERAARFQREARSLAMLQHPNVASIYGFEEVDGVRFLVMELVEGEDLSEHLKKGKPSLEEARRIAGQMAAGLEVAHEKGIVHRDLKPANVMLDADGQAKILDFGLARAWFGETGEDADITQSPTITAAMTQAGTILGTAAYMSPEQARGRNVDRRADIWAFGVILWEMVTGSPLFEGETISDTLAAVLRAEPEWERLPVDDAPDLCRLIERCLVRDPKQRLRDIGEARLLLEGGDASQSRLAMPAVDVSVPPGVPPKVPIFGPRAVVAAVVGIAVGFGVGWMSLRSPTAAESPVLHLMVPPPAGVEFDLNGVAPGPARLSPDGRMLSFTGYDEEGVTRLYLRHLDREESVALPGTDGAAYPFWSPDSQFIGFFTPASSQKLKKVAVTGGPPITLCSATNGKGASWNAEGTIIFAPSHDVPLFRVPDIGGDPDSLTTLGNREGSHRHPRFLPDGDHYLYLVRRSDTTELHSIRLASLSDGDIRDLTESEGQAEYSQGHLVTAREGNLIATPFDLAKNEFVGGGFPIVEQIMVASSGSAVGAFSFSDRGMMTYQTGYVESARGLQWIDLAGGGITPLATTGSISHPRVSPDGTRCMVEVRGESGEGTDLWLVDLNTGLRTRFTFDEGDELFPVWEPDGSHVIYVARSDSEDRVLRQPVDTTGGAVVLAQSSEAQFQPSDVDPTGKRLYLDRSVDNVWNIVWLDLEAEPGSAALEDLLVTPEVEGSARVSPDGRWLAYHTTSASRFDIFIRPVDGGPRKWQITTSGTVWPQWSADGSELYACGFTGTITAYPIARSGEGILVGSPRIVTTVPSPGAGGSEYSVDPQGGRILSVMDLAGDRDAVSFVHVVTDWRRGLGR